MTSGPFFLSFFPSLLLAALLLLILPSDLFAQDPRFSIGAAGSIVLPNEKALFGDDVKIDNAFMPEINLTIFLPRQFSIELSQGWYEADIRDKSAGADMGKLSVYPLRLTLQYRYQDEDIASYYIGAGIGYFFTNFDTDNSFASALGQSAFTVDINDGLGGHFSGGFDYFLARNFAVNLDLKYWIASADMKYKGTTVKGSDTYHLDSFSAGLGLKLFL